MNPPPILKISICLKLLRQRPLAGAVQHDLAVQALEQVRELRVAYLSISCETIPSSSNSDGSYRSPHKCLSRFYNRSDREIHSWQP